MNAIRREHGRPGWMPQPRFRFFSNEVPLSGREIRNYPLETPRPVDWLMNLRSHPSCKVSARDHLMLEVLASVVYEAMLHDSCIPALASKSGLVSGQLTVKLSSVLGITSLGGIETREAAEASLQRLSHSTFLLPSPRVPGLRKSQKQRIAEKRQMLGLEEQSEWPTGQPFAPRMTWEDAEIERSITDEYNRRIREGRAPKRIEGILQDRRPRKKARIILPIFGPHLKELLTANPLALQGGVEREAYTSFCPIERFIIGCGDGSEDWIAFEPAGALVDTLDRDRLVGWKRVPYIFLDLSAMAAFSSRYSAPLYKLILSETYSDIYRRPRHDEKWTWERTPDEIAKIVSYARQGGGWRGQVARNVVSGFNKDMRKLDPGQLSVEAIDVRPQERVDDRFRFEICVPLPDLRKIRTFVTNLETAEMRDLTPPDAAPYGISILPVLKARSLLSLDGEETRRLTIAWRMAVDETFNQRIPYYADVSGKGTGRRYRGRELQIQVKAMGADRAFVGFALEENRHPDLTKPEILDRLYYEGTLDAIDGDRIYRVAQSRHGFSPTKVIRERYTEGLQDFLASKASERKGRATEATDISRRKNDGRSAARQRRRLSQEKEEWRLDAKIKQKAFDALTDIEKNRMAEEEERLEKVFLALQARHDAKYPGKPRDRSSMSAIDLLFDDFLGD